MSVNNVTLLGRLSADPEFKETSGDDLCKFDVATSEHWTNKDGEAQERVEYTKVVVWGNQAAACNEHLKKGSAVYVDGRLQTRSWEGDDGIKKYTTEVNSRVVKFL